MKLPRTYYDINIFFLDVHPMHAAIMQCDKHVVKMTLESAQLLCTAHHVLGTDLTNLYKPTHKNHPCAKWVRASAQNYRWLYFHFKTLAAEYTYRFGKVHLTWAKVGKKLARLPNNIPNTGMTRPPSCLPAPYVSKTPIIAYQKYYIGKRLAGMDMRWTDRAVPSFMQPQPTTKL